MGLVATLRKQPKSRFFSAGCLSIGAFGIACTLTTPSRADGKMVYADVQPIFRAHCYRCHSSDQKAGGFALDSREGILKGGQSGLLVMPGKSSASVLIDRLRGLGGKPQMPMGFGPITDSDLKLIETWIDDGCLDTPNDRKAHWAYVKPVRPPIPRVSNPKWVRNPIDSFVLARLEKEHLKPSPEADKVTLIRRVTLDLIGLPPTTAEVDAFLADSSPNAYEKVVDRLFDNPHYGERMALPWLDAARYADSNGFQEDGDTYQYVWRDWVVRAMNENMPFDKFTVEQLAGDLLPDANQATREGREEIVASAFNRDHMLNGEGGAIPEEQRNVALFDRVDTTSTTWLGITMGCARCHDHKYDPFTQRDYYSMMAFFNNVPESGIVGGDGSRFHIADPWIYAGTDDQMARLRRLEPAVAVAQEKPREYEDSPKEKTDQTVWEASAIADNKLPAEILAILKIAPRSRNADQANKLKSFFLDNALAGVQKDERKKWQDLQKQLDDLRAQIPRVMVMSDRQPRESHIYSRGNYEAPLAKVTCSTPTVLPPMPKNAPKNRLGFAEWVVSPDNPLTARVQVNRYWQTFFGRGLVRTPENFGILGEKPTHPELLDWLAVEFRESGWNVKGLQRLIVTSATYRQSSKESPFLREHDPDNRLLARGGRFRLPSLLIRDEALAESGLLNPAIGGKPVYPYQPKGIWDSLDVTTERDFKYPQSKGADLYRRSIYTFWRRTVSPGDMFDASARQVCTVRFSQTSTPLHALTTLNDATWVEAGRVLGERVMHRFADPDERLDEAFRRVCARRPDSFELKVLRRSLDRALQAFKADPKAAALYLKEGESPPDAKFDPVEDAAYATVCSEILNLDEALTRE